MRFGSMAHLIMLDSRYDGREALSADMVTLTVALTLATRQLTFTLIQLYLASLSGTHTCTLAAWPI